MLSFCLALSACGSTPTVDAPQRLDVTKRRLVRLPVDYKTGALGIGEDGITWSFALRQGDGVTFRGNDGVLGTYKEASPPNITPKTLQTFFWALDASGPAPRAGFVFNKVMTSTPIARPSPAIISPDGTRWAVVGPIGSLTEEPKELQPVVVYIDGAEHGRAFDVSRPAFSADGRHTAWLAENDAGTLTLVKDEAVVKTYTAPQGTIDHPISMPLRRTLAAPGSAMDRQYQVQFLSDGRLIALVRDAAGWTIERDGTALASYALNTGSRPDQPAPDLDPFASASAIVPESLALAEDAPVAVWWERPAGAGGQWRVVRDGQTVDGIVCLSPWTTQPTSLSADGTHVAYVCPTRDGTGPGDPHRAYVVIDGRRFGPYTNVWGLRLSDDGAHAAWAGATSAAKDATWHYAIDGRVIVDGFDEAWRPRLDPSGQHLAWLGRRQQKVFLGLDDRVHASAEEVLWGPKFVDPHTLGWVVRRGRNLVRLDVKFP